MSAGNIEQIKQAMNALEHLRQAQDKLPVDSKKLIDEACGHVRRTDWPNAKLALVKLLESRANAPEELWIALVDVLGVLKETDIPGLLDYIDKGKPKDDESKT